MTAAPTGPEAAALHLSNVSKQFDGPLVLDAVDLTVAPGEVHGLLGQNGSGKSTLVKILAGFHEPEPGASLMMGGREIPMPLAPGQYRDLGMGFIFQDLGLVPGLTVLENLTIGERAGASGLDSTFINWGRERRRVRQMLDAYGVAIRPGDTVGDLQAVNQALLAIIKAVEELKLFSTRTGSRHQILLLDEPTVFLPKAELRFLFDLLRTITAGGGSAIFISHDLAAVREIADRVTVLRDGRITGQAAVGDVTDDDLIRMITGRERGAAKAVATAGRTKNASRRAAVVSVQGLAGGHVRGVDFEVGAGEVVGVAGLLGSGAEELPYLLFGSEAATGGQVTMGQTEQPATALAPPKAVGMGMALVPADRHRDGGADLVSVLENMLILVVNRFFHRGMLRRRPMRDTGRRRVSDLDIRPGNPDAHFTILSGGNQQKVVLAKWLEMNPKLMILHEPTQGVDVGARSDIYRIISGSVDDGLAVICVSTDFNELAALCDRVLVMAGGEIVDELSSDLSKDTINAVVYEYAASARAVAGAGQN